MIGRLFVLYLALALSVVFSVAATFGPGLPGRASYPLISLSLLVICVVLRFGWKASKRTALVASHERAVDRVTLAFAVAGVVAAYQWLFLFSRLSETLNLNDVLQAVGSVIQVLTVLYLVYALLHLLVRRPVN